MGDPSASVLPIVLDGLVFRAGGRAVIRDLSARIAAPDITALIGPNGAGKSVCLRLLDGLLTPDHGSIRFGDGPKRDPRRAFVFQRTGLIRASVAANVGVALAPARLPRRVVRCRVAEALAAVDLSHRSDDAAPHLSGGEAQRLAIARAIVTNPELLLLDEPTANLDPQATEDIEALVLAMAARGVKVLLVSHNLGQVARLAGDLLMIADGTIVEHGETRQVLTSPRHPDAIRYLAGELPWSRCCPGS